MVTVIFYEKPGCINNAKQKALLKASGHLVESHNLLTETWTTTTLRSFFGDLPVPDWFNRTAPQIKSGEIDPDTISAETALDLMLKNTLLIRRPLMQVNDHRKVGFETETIDAWIGLQAANRQHKPVRDALIQQDLETCPNSNKFDREPCN